MKKRNTESLKNRKTSVRREIRILIDKNKDGYTGHVEGVTGVVVGQGDSESDVILNTVSALKFHLETFLPEAMPAQSRIVLAGRAMFEGTGIFVSDVLEEIASGKTIEQILEKHPELNRESIREALRYASRVVAAVRKN